VCGCPLCTASTFLCGSNPANLRIRSPSLASFTHELSERSDRSHTKTSYQYYSQSYSCHTLTPFSLPVSVASEHTDNKWHATFLRLLLNQLRAYIIYSHLHVTLNSYHNWEFLLNILVPAIKQKSTSCLFHLRLVSIRLVRFLLLSNLWLWLTLYICVLYFLFNCMLVLFSHFGYNEINIHTFVRWSKDHTDCLTIRYYTIEEFNVDSKAEYTA